MFHFVEDDVVRRNLKRELPCELTDEEFTRVAKQRAIKEIEMAQLEADLAKEKKRRQDQIDDFADDVAKMGRELATGEQDRVVACNDYFVRGDDGGGYVVTIRLDTRAEVERRQANANEVQRYLPGTGDVNGGGVLDQAARAQRKAEAGGAGEGDDDVPAGGDHEDEDGDDGPDDAKPRKPKPEKFDVAQLADGRCALRFEGGDGCGRELGHDGLHKSASHSWKARRPKPVEAAGESAAAGPE